jgi:hypothetical protein
MVRMSFESCPVGILLKKHGRARFRSLILKKCATGIKLLDESNVEIFGASCFNCGIMLNACRGSNAKATNCFLEGIVSLETRSKAFFAHCTIACCSWCPVQEDRLQLQINRLQLQPAITCQSAAQVDLRAVSILNYGTALRAQHKDSKIHATCCQIYGCANAAVEVLLPIGHRFTIIYIHTGRQKSVRQILEFQTGIKECHFHAKEFGRQHFFASMQCIYASVFARRD